MESSDSHQDEEPPVQGPGSSAVSSRAPSEIQESLLGKWVPGLVPNAHPKEVRRSAEWPVKIPCKKMREE